MTQTTISWVEFRDHLQDLCHELYDDHHLYADCILKTEGKEVYCHRSILSASSDYFKQIFESYSCESMHTEIILPEISFSSLQSLICFIYKGELFIDCKDLNNLWDAATLLDVKSIKAILDGFFTQTQITTLDDTLDALVQDLRETDSTTVSSPVNAAVDKSQTSTEVEDIQMELIDALIPIVPVVVVANQNKPVSDAGSLSRSVGREVKTDKIMETDIPFVNFQKQTGPESRKDKRVIKHSGIKLNLSLTSLAMLREKALQYQKELESAIRDCKKGMSLEEACQRYSISKEALYRNIKNFKLPHIVPPST